MNEIVKKEREIKGTTIKMPVQTKRKPKAYNGVIRDNVSQGKGRGTMINSVMDLGELLKVFLR